ncbi:hypothetical protein [Actinomadura alba]|uniref:Uncharacterized protein n=1 Tax=Actinomadura alba TaxID=406431 RepID=A0ABR7M2J5_9ACTN|nr:hypothetical protein [Actinomadura alba]MBC6471337.1 hypothetical protein [Actinomadura alba]
MIRTLRKMGVSSSMLFGAGFASIAASVVSWVMSHQFESTAVDRADRWGIFIGEWAPTFFALGTAMRIEEVIGEEGPEEMAGMRAPTGAVPVG